MYYAQLDTGSNMDLHRFETKVERDEFVSNRPSSAMTMTRKEAEIEHKEQFAYWKKEL